MREVKFVCDIGGNHNQNKDRVIKLIEEAARIGCYAAKFQLFDERLAGDDADAARVLSKRKLPPDWLPGLAETCHVFGVKFFCTPFSLEAVSLLDPYVDGWKIGSREVKWGALFDEVLARSGENRPLGISLGALRRWSHFGKMHAFSYPFVIPYLCRSDYPALPSDCNLFDIRELSRSWSNCGWSDHTVDRNVIMAAVVNGADWIEFHMDLPDMMGLESVHGHCWPSTHAAEMIREVKRIVALSNQVGTPIQEGMLMTGPDGIRRS